MQGWRPWIESALCLDLSRLFAAHALRPDYETSGTWQWTRGGKRVASVGYRAELAEREGMLTLDYTSDGKPEQSIIRLSTVQNHFGGANWFMHCPATGRRARKLYKWSGLAYFRHREAVRPRPTYSSQRDSGSDRINRQRWELRRKLGDEGSDLFGEPIKPKWMRRRTFERFAARDAQLAMRDNACLLHLAARLFGNAIERSG